MTSEPPEIVRTLAVRRVDRWLLVYHAHIWAARFPNVLYAAVGLAFLSAVASVFLICLMKVVPDPLLCGLGTVYLAVLHGWASMQAKHVMPDGPRITRPPGADAAVGLLAFVSACIVGAALFAPALAVIALDKTMEQSDSRVRATVRDLQLGVAYMPERQENTQQALNRELLLQYGESPAAVRRYALGVLRRKDRGQAIADLTRFRNALASTQVGGTATLDVPRCAEGLLSNVPPQSIKEGELVGTSLFKSLRLVYCGYEQFYSAMWSGEFWRHRRILAWTEREQIMVLSVGIVLISLWTAVTLACNAAYESYLWFPAASLFASLYMRVNDEPASRGSARDQLAMYAILVLWILVAAALTALLIVPRLRISGADFLNATMLASIVLIIARFLLPSGDILRVFPHAIAVTVTCILLAPYGNYTRKRAGIAPQP